MLLPQIKAGKIKPIAVGAPKRVPARLMCRPPANRHARTTHEELYGMIARARRRLPVVAALNKAAVAAMKDPVVVDKLASQGATLVGDTPDDSRAYIDSETKKWARSSKTPRADITK